MSRLPFIVSKQKSVNLVIGRWGLGNRVLSMGCTLSLAKELNYSTTVLWPADIIVGGVRFEDLFDTAELPFKLVEGYEAWLTGNIVFGHPKRGNPLKNVGFRILRSAILPQYDKQIDLKTVEAHGEYMKLQSADLLQYRRMLVSAHRLFRYDCDVGWLKPARHIIPRIMELKNQFTPDTVGVHFRGTDWIYTPPVEKIITRMHAEVELNPDVKFFFASDGDKLGERVIDIFGDRLIINTVKAPKRRTTQGQENAVTDLFALAGTSRIIGFDYSSFTTLAALIGNKPILKLAV